MQLATKIHSCGSYLPSQVIDSDDFFSDLGLYKNYGIPNNWMSRIMGIRERRMSPDSEMPSSLAVKAAQVAIDRSPDVNTAEIDVLIFCGIEKDQCEPATAHNVQKELGLSAKHVFDVTNACFGFFDGLELADLYVSSGRARYALVVTGETQKKLSDSLCMQLKGGVSEKYVRNMLGFFSLGDAGGAMIIGPTGNNDCNGFKFFKNQVNSNLADKCYYRVGKNGKYEGQMLMHEIMSKGFDMQAKTLKRNMNDAGWEKFDWLLTHQTGKKNYDQTIGLGVVKPKGLIKTFHVLGNVTSATLPITFDTLIRNRGIKAGDNIGGAFAGSGLVIGQFGYTY